LGKNRLTFKITLPIPRLLSALCGFKKQLKYIIKNAIITIIALHWQIKYGKRFLHETDEVLL